MIHYTPEGHRIKLGLNFSGAPGGFRMLWAWYDFASHSATTYRFRFRWHMAPRFMWEVKTFDVIEGYLTRHDLVLVHREVLQDLKDTEESRKKRNERLSNIKP